MQIPPEIASFLKRCGVNPDKVLEYRITQECFGMAGDKPMLERPQIEVKLAPRNEQVNIEVKSVLE